MFNIFLKNLLKQIIANGKMLVGFVLLQIPGIEAYPTILAAVHGFVADPSTANALKLVLQAIIVLGAGHRIVKLIKAALKQASIKF